MATGELDRSLVGAYGRERKEYIKFQSSVRQTQRMQEIREEGVRHRGWDKKKTDRTPKPLASLSPAKQPRVKEMKKVARITRLIEIRAGYYEAELLKELKLRKESIDDDVEEADVVPIYREYRPLYPILSPSPPREAVPMSYSVRHQSDKTRSRDSDAPVRPGKSFSSPPKAGSQRTVKLLNSSLASTQEKVLQAEQDGETRRQRLLERSIQELDQKLARLAHHRHSSSLTDVPTKHPPPRLRRN